VLGLLPKDRQSLFYSATLNRDVDMLVKAELVNPAIVSLKKRDTASTVDQDIIRVNGGQQKVDTLHDLLIQEDFSKVLIFGRTKRGVDKLSKILLERGFRVDCIHGDKTQNARQFALTKFKQDRVSILVATDVAARGLDIPNVSHVINYELPETYEDYIHRIGRTGRANKLGKALTFVE
jgi:superfamily II DNA/RNA helicase